MHAPVSDVQTQAGVPSSRRHRNALRTVLLLAVVGLGPLAALQWNYWLAEHLFALSHLAAAALFIASLMSLVLRRFAIAAFAMMLGTADAAVVVAHTGWPRSTEPAPMVCETTIHVATVNVLGPNRTPLILHEYLKTKRFGIVFLQEVGGKGRWGRFFKSLLDVYPYQVISKRGDVAIVARIPIRAEEPDSPLARDLANPFLVPSTVAASARIGNRDVVLISAHLTSLQTQGMYKQRNRQFDLLTEALERETRPVIVGADLNGVSWSPHVSRFVRANDLRYLDFSGIRIATRPNWLPVAGIQIDYILPTASVFTGTQNVGPDVGSDHLPLEADLCVLPN